jgi:hypothetical protein|tara:strand:- start:856 stop:1041 length:186 start_codon:yes stop_codon:yes gene_type:complete
MSDEDLYSECDVVDFIEADAEKRAEVSGEMTPVVGRLLFGREGWISLGDGGWMKCEEKSLT